MLKDMDKKNKIILGSGISFAAFTMLATIISAFIEPEAPDPDQLSPRTKVAYMASKQFSRLPETEKIKYVKKVGRTRGVYRQLSEQERQTVRKNIRKVAMAEMKERTNKFFSMSQEEQNKYLDEMIARRNRWRAAREARRNQNNNSASRGSSNNNADNNNSNRRQGNRNARRQAFLESMDSTTRAQMTEIHRRMREREKQTSK